MSFLFLGVGDLFLLEGLFTRVVYSKRITKFINKISQTIFGGQIFEMDMKYLPYYTSL